MALVVFVRGINVGGHRRFRPSQLAARMRRFDLVNIGAAGTLIVRSAPSVAALRAELARYFPVDSDVMICQGRDIHRLVSRPPFPSSPPPMDVVRFVSILARRPRSAPPIPLRMPPKGPWLLKVLATDGRFVMGVYRRQMKVIACLEALDGLFGSRATTRSWGTIETIARVLREGRLAHPSS